MSVWGVEGSWPASTKSRALCAGGVFGNGAAGSRTGEGGQRGDVVSSWGHRGPPWGPSEEPHEALPRTTCLAEGRKAHGDITTPALLGGERASACGTVQNWSPFLSLGVQEGVPSHCPCQAGRSLVCPSCHREATGSPVAGPSVGSQSGPCEWPGGCPAVSGTALQREPGHPPSPPPWLLRAWPTARAPAADRRWRHSPRDSELHHGHPQSLTTIHLVLCFVSFPCLFLQDKRFEQRCEGTHRLHLVFGGDPDLGQPFQACGFAPESLSWGLKGNWVRLGDVYSAPPTRNVSCSLGQAASTRICQSGHGHHSYRMDSIKKPGVWPLTPALLGCARGRVCGLPPRQGAIRLQLGRARQSPRGARQLE